MGTLFMVNPPKRKSRKRRTAKQKAATRKMLAANRKRRGAKRARPTRRKATRTQRKRVSPMARRRTRKRATSRRRSTAKRRSPVTTLARRRVYVTNPRRRRRGMRRYRRNQPRLNIMATIQQGAMDAGATLVGGALARTLSAMIPLPKDGLTNVATGFGVAVGLGLIVNQTKVVRPDTARFIVAGAMQVPVKNLITMFLPQAGAFLGDYDNIGAYEIGNGMVGDYLDSGGMAEAADESYIEVGAY